MSEAFPNQVPKMITDDMEAESPTPDTRHPSRVFLDSDELENDAYHLNQIGMHFSENFDNLCVVSIVVFICGVTTLLHTIFRSRLLLIQGPSFVYLAFLHRLAATALCSGKTYTMVEEFVLKICWQAWSP